VLVPLAVWQARREELLARRAAARWACGWPPRGRRRTRDDLGKLLQAVGLHFPKFTDGRSYSAANLLRTRYGYQGELRAIGEVLRDQFNYMTRCGFDTLQPQGRALHRRPARGGGGQHRRLHPALPALGEGPAAAVPPRRARHRPRGAAMNAAVSLLRPAPTNAATRPQLTDACAPPWVPSPPPSSHCCARPSPSSARQLAFANSFGAEDMVLTDLILSNGLPIRSSRSTPGACPGDLQPDRRRSSALRH
jgi:uncharacterized protein (DUF934 family)